MSGFPSARSVLVAIDDGPASSRALASAVEIAAASGGRLTVMHVLTPLCAKSCSGYLVSIPTPSDEFGEQLLEAAVARAGERVPVHTVLRRGNVAEEILARIDAGEHDLVVVGRGRRRRVLPWSSAGIGKTLRARSRAHVVVADP